jgi:GR25 family glycosyltransferase involved in LPS biosynthesis
MVFAAKKVPFSKVYLINRKSRVDRLLTVVEILGIVDIDFEVVDAVDINSHEIIEAAKVNNLRAGETACYASHMAVLRKALIEKFPSILVLEDDIDMDLGVKEQFFEIIQGLDDRKDIPWDLLFFGHCLEARGVFVMKTTNFELLQSVHPSCTHAYAITLNGIQKMLYNYQDYINSPEKLQIPIDYMFQKAMNEKVIVGYSIFPQIVIQHRTGSGLKSDLRPEEELDQPQMRKSALSIVQQRTSRL